MKEPSENVESSAHIPETLQFHKIVSVITKDKSAYNQIFKLSKDDKPFFTQSYRSENDTQVCGYPENDVGANTCGHYLADYDNRKRSRRMALLSLM